LVIVTSRNDHDLVRQEWPQVELEPDGYRWYRLGDR
jgi:hypothetical protein